MIFETQEQLDAALEQWQGILRLRDWRVRARLTARADFVRQGAKGESHIYFDKQEALLLILDAPSVLSGSAKAMRDWDAQDMERTLVHELLHIYFHAFRPDEDEEKTAHDLWERAIEVMAERFVMLDRRSAELTTNQIDAPRTNGKTPRHVLKTPATSEEIVRTLGITKKQIAAAERAIEKIGRSAP